jgi:hypothetical protein
VELDLNLICGDSVWFSRTGLQLFPKGGAGERIRFSVAHDTLDQQAFCPPVCKPHYDVWLHPLWHIYITSFSLNKCQYSLFTYQICARLISVVLVKKHVQQMIIQTASRPLFVEEEHVFSKCALWMLVHIRTIGM